MSDLQNEIIIDAFSRIKDEVHQVLKGLSKNDLIWQPSDRANSIDWLIWHLTRIQDDHIADLAQTEQIWQQGWSKKFGFPFSESDTGYGHRPSEVKAVQADSKLLLEYYDAVHENTVKFVRSLKTEDYKKIIDKRWNPPVTLATRLVSILSDDLQHIGQAAYIKGLR